MRLGLLKVNDVNIRVQQLSEIKDCTEGNEASEYLVEKSEFFMLKIKQKALSNGINEDFVHDIYQDTYLSLVASEENGDGYDSKYSEKNNLGFEMTLEKFISGRISGIMKNEKYYPERMVKGMYTSYTGGVSDEKDTLSYTYYNTPDEITIEDNIDKLDLEESLRFIVNEGESQGINIINLIKQVNSFIGESKSDNKHIRSVLSHNFKKLSRECQDEFVRFMSFEDSGTRTMVLERLENEIVGAGETWGI